MDARFGLFINSLATESKVDITFGKKYLLDGNIDLKKKKFVWEVCPTSDSVLPSISFTSLP